MADERSGPAAGGGLGASGGDAEGRLLALLSRYRRPIGMGYLRTPIIEIF
jgi:hypothetical protein